VEGIVRRYPAVAEFQIEVFRRGELDEMRLLVEVGDAGAPRAVQDALRAELGLRVDVVPVTVGSLPRWELKARRVVRHEAP
jgi:phenylacetate-CoA ligase